MADTKRQEAPMEEVQDEVKKDMEAAARPKQVEQATSTDKPLEEHNKPRGNKWPAPSPHKSMAERTRRKLAASLAAAAGEGKLELVRLLLRCGAEVNGQDDELGNTALHQAAWNGFSQTVQLLCRHRANTSIRNKAHFTPLHMACQQGHNQTARLLLMANSRPEARNSYGDTPLHTAARYGHAGVARILLSARCEPNQVNKNHDTPLHIAAAMGRRKLTKIFMQHGAEPAIKNKQGETAMDIALRKDLIDIQELIANPPAPHRKRRLAAATSGSAGGSASGAGSCGQLYASARHAVRELRLSAGEEALSSELEHRLGQLTLRDTCRLAAAGRRRPAGKSRARCKTLTSAADLHLLTRRADSPPPPGPQRAESASPEKARSVASSGASARNQLKRPPALLVRRPNCVSRLLLLKAARPASRADSGASSRRKEGPPAACGRRQERLDRMRHLSPAEARGQQVAPNGNRLVASKPLAALSDLSQLYAVPKKCPVKRLREQQERDQQVALDTRAHLHQLAGGCERPARAGSDGPALTCASECSGGEVGERTSGERHSPETGAAISPETGSGPPCLCEPTQQVAGGPPAELLHLAAPGSAQSEQQQQQESGVAADDIKEPAAAAKSRGFWLKSRFSLAARRQRAAKGAANNGGRAKAAQLDCAEPTGIQMGADRAAGSGGELPAPSRSAVSADLIAAQRSLAAAAAAKVKRDRLARLVGALEHQQQQQQQQQQQRQPQLELATREPQAATGVPGVLTVKTGAEHDGRPFSVGRWPLAPSAGGASAAVQAQKYLAAENGAPGQTHRSGSNSAGMSDSSPSNNGADSDNSLHTTTGSLNTDNASANEPAASASSSSSPLGILSRILLNNTTTNKAYLLHADQQQQQLGSSASSSSPSAGANPQTGAARKLEQLVSRSRQPIVVARSNELPAAAEAAAEEELSVGPPLPSKSALKQRQLPALVANRWPQQEPMNGLPRVASLSHLQQTSYKSLCNFHSGAHTQPSYAAAPHFRSPYSPPGSNAESSLQQPPLPLHLSQRELRLPASALNYEYYLSAASPAADLFHYHHFCNQQPQQQYTDDSIYIPAYTLHEPALRDGHLSVPDARAQPITAPLCPAARPARPKSSLDAPTVHLGAGEGSSPANGQHRLFSANYQSSPPPPPTTTTKVNLDSFITDVPASHATPAAAATGKLAAAAAAASFYRASCLADSEQAASFLYAAAESSIYAHRPHSDLTVLPEAAALPQQPQQQPQAPTNARREPVEPAAAAGGEPAQRRHKSLVQVHLSAATKSNQSRASETGQADSNRLPVTGVCGAAAVEAALGDLKPTNNVIGSAARIQNDPLTSKPATAAAAAPHTRLLISGRGAGVKMGDDKLIREPCNGLESPITTLKAAACTGSTVI